MTREEILKLASANANGQNLMDLVQKIEAYLNGDSPKIPIEVYKERIKQTQNLIEHAPRDEFYVDPNNAPAVTEDARKYPFKKRKRPTIAPTNHCVRWTAHQKKKAAELIKQAKLPSDLPYIAQQLGRTEKALKVSLHKGLFPVDPKTLNKTAFPHWDKVPYPAGEEE